MKRITITLIITVALALAASAWGQIPCDNLTPEQCYDVMIRDYSTRVAAHEAEQWEAGFDVKRRRDRANRYAIWCQAADLVMTVAGIEAFGAREMNPLFPMLNTDNSTERIGGYALIALVKYGLVRFSRMTASTGDDWVSAGVGCGAAAWNAYQISR